MYEVTFETKCWEKDWRYVLDPDRIRRVIADNSYDFKYKIIYINNVGNLEEVKQQAQKLVDKKIITSFVVVSDYAEAALKFFGISKDSFDGGYYYSIQELVGIYLCKTDYLLHYSSDAAPAKQCSWIDQAITEMVNNKQIKVSNLTWNNKYYQARREAINQDENFYIGFGFSDQNYLIKTKDFRSQIFNETRPSSNRYPKYGGELFEKRVDSWMRNHEYLRATFKHGSYIHKNFEKKKLRAKLTQTPGKISKIIQFTTNKVKKR